MQFFLMSRYTIKRVFWCYCLSGHISTSQLLTVDAEKSVIKNDSETRTAGIRLVELEVT